MKLSDVWAAVCRWRSSPLLRSYEWKLSPGYWRVRRAASLVQFQSKKLNFKARLAARNFWDKSSIVGHILQLIVWRFIAAVLVVALLMLAERYVKPPHFLALGLSVKKEAQLSFLSSLAQVWIGG